MLLFKQSIPRGGGGRLIAVPPRNTGRACPSCGHVSADNGRTQARFACVECGHEDDADVVGAISILSRRIQQLRDEGEDMNDASFRCDSTARIACEVSGALMPPAAGGPPKRPRSNSMPRLSVAGLSGLQARKDVNGNVLLAGNCSVDPRGDEARRSDSRARGTWVGHGFQQTIYQGSFRTTGRVA